MVALFFTKRFLFNLRKNSQTFFMIVLCVIGISLSVCVLLFSASLVLGFLSDHFRSITSVEGHIVVHGFYNDKNALAAIHDASDYEYAVKVIRGETVILPYGFNKETKGVSVICMDAEGMKDYLRLNTTLNTSYDPPLKDNEVLLGRPAYDVIGKGSKVRMMMADLSQNVGKSRLPFQEFRVAGYFSVGSMAVDKSLVIVNYAAGKKLLGNKGHYNMMLFFRDFLNTAEKKEDILNSGLMYNMNTWQDRYSNHLKVLRVQLFVVGLFMVSLLCVCVLNIFASVAIVVITKRDEIVLLRALGLSRWDCFCAFFGIGLAICLVATGIGLLLGSILSYNLDVLQDLLTKFGVIDLETWRSIHGIAAVRSDVGWRVYAIIAAISMSISAIAAVFPAYRATKVPFNTVLRD